MDRLIQIADVFYAEEPFFQDGIVAQAVDHAANDWGVAYFSAAGNQGERSYEATFADAGDAGTEAAAVCRALGIEHIYLDVETAFKESVIEPAICAILLQPV